MCDQVEAEIRMTDNCIICGAAIPSDDQIKKKAELCRKCSASLAKEKKPQGTYSTFMYFCGICWRKIKERDCGQS